VAVEEKAVMSKDFSLGRTALITLLISWYVQVFGSKSVSVPIISAIEIHMTGTTINT
jgi:hypothetical protein